MEPVLEADAGPLRGAREGRLAVFRGVRYAAPPLEAERSVRGGLYPDVA